jgi:hypothetical protein
VFLRNISNGNIYEVNMKKIIKYRKISIVRVFGFIMINLHAVGSICHAANCAGESIPPPQPFSICIPDYHVYIPGHGHEDFHTMRTGTIVYYCNNGVPAFYISNGHDQYSAGRCP